MSNARFLACCILALSPLLGCSFFGPSDTEKKLESELSNLMLDQQILETRLSLAEDRVISLQTQVNEIHGSVYSGSEKADGTTEPAKAAAAQPAVPQAGAESAYQNALDSFMAHKYKQAEGMFADFIKKFPQSSLMPNSSYWLGECHYAQKRYDEAIISFQSVVKNYPTHQKAADSLLKTGYSYEKLGDKANARFYLEQVLEIYPTTHAASLARPMLAGLG